MMGDICVGFFICVCLDQDLMCGLSWGRLWGHTVFRVEGFIFNLCVCMMESDVLGLGVFPRRSSDMLRDLM